MRVTLALLCMSLTMVDLPASAGVKDELLKDWAERRAGLHSAKFVVKSSITVKAGSKGPSEKDSRKLLPLTDYTYDEHRTIVVDLTLGRLRREVRGQKFMHGGGLDTFRPTFEFQIFDGKAVGFVEPKAENESEVYKPSKLQPELTIFSQGQLRTMMPSDDLPIMASIGICLPFWKRKEVASLLDVAGNSQLFQWPAGGPDAAREIVLRAIGPRQGNMEEWRIASQLNGAPTSVRIFEAGRPWVVVEVQYDASSPPMPKRWTTMRLKDRSKVDFSKVSELVSYERNPVLADETFTIPLEGKEVIVKDGRYHRATDDGRFVPTTMSELKRQLNSSSMNNMPFALAIAAVSALGVLVFKRMSRRAV